MILCFSLDVNAVNSVLTIRPGGNGGHFTYSQAIVQNGRRHNILNKVKLVESKGLFAEHCKGFDYSHKVSILNDHI